MGRMVSATTKTLRMKACKPSWPLAAAPETGAQTAPRPMQHTKPPPPLGAAMGTWMLVGWRLRREAKTPRRLCAATGVWAWVARRPKLGEPAKPPPRLGAAMARRTHLRMPWMRRFRWRRISLGICGLGGSAFWSGRGGRWRRVIPPTRNLSRCAAKGGGRRRCGWKDAIGLGRGNCWRRTMRGGFPRRRSMRSSTPSTWRTRPIPVGWRSPRWPICGRAPSVAPAAARRCRCSRPAGCAGRAPSGCC